MVAALAMQRSVGIITLTLGAEMGFFDSILGGLGSVFGIASASSEARKARAQQEDFAKHGIQYKVADARAAGINPYAALGASTSMPAAVVGSSSGFSEAGQNIGRALDSVSPEATRLARLAEEKAKLENKNLEIQNIALASDVARKNQPATPPAPPSIGQRWRVDGQGNSGQLVKDEPMKRTVQGELRGGDPGVLNEFGLTRSEDGSISIVPSKESMERQSNDMIGMLQWNLRNRVVDPIMRGGARTFPGSKEIYSYNILTGKWSPTGVYER